MKFLVAFVVFLLAVLTLLGISLLDVEEHEVPPSSVEPAHIAASSNPRVVELENQIATLTEQIEELQFDISNLNDGRRSALPDVVPTLDLEGDHDAQWYLGKYVASFEQTSQGAEYFRLAVQAYLPSLLKEVGVLIHSAGANDVLRRKLVEMLGDERFKGTSTVVKLVIGRLEVVEHRALQNAAVGALETIATGRDIQQLEALVWGIHSEPVQKRCLNLITRLAGRQINEVILSLMQSAPNEAARAHLIKLIDPRDLDVALQIFQFASGEERPTRLEAARRISYFRSEAITVFVAEWIGYEPDEEIRQLLGAAQERHKLIPNWHAMQMMGAPNVQDASKDSPKAWASAEADNGPAWVELTYDRAFRANAVRIHEVHVAGGVTEVHAIESSGEIHLLWSGIDPTTSPGVFQVEFSLTPYAVRRIRIVLDTSRKKGWNEIDAVELVGRSNRAWAKSAEASSYFGGHTSRSWK